MFYGIIIRMFFRDSEQHHRLRKISSVSTPPWPPQAAG